MRHIVTPLSFSPHISWGSHPAKGSVVGETDGTSVLTVGQEVGDEVGFPVGIAVGLWVPGGRLEGGRMPWSDGWLRATSLVTLLV